MDIQIKKKLIFATLLSVVIMSFLLFKVDFDQFSLIANRINGTYCFLALIFLFLYHFVRSYRFQMLDHVGNKLGYWWNVNQVYNIITFTLPGGPGEAVSAYLLKRYSKFNMLSAVRIFLLTRLMDLAGFGALLLCTAILIRSDNPYRQAALWVSVLVLISSIIVTHPKAERLIMRLLQKIPVKGRIMQKIYERLADVTKISEECFSGSVYGVSMFQSLLVAGSLALSTTFMMQALGTEFTLIQGLYCAGIYALFQVVPVHGVAGIGTQTTWWSIALSAAGYKASDAIAMGLVLHGSLYLLNGTLGLCALLFWIVKHKRSE